MIIASIATFATVWVWLMILLSQIVMRRTLSPEETRQLSFRCRGGRWRRHWRPPLWHLSSACSATSKRAASRCTSGWCGSLYSPWLTGCGCARRRRLAGERGNAADVTLASDKTRCGGFYCAFGQTPAIKNPPQRVLFSNRIGRTYWPLTSFRPLNGARSPSASSIRISWLYLATRSERLMEPVLIWPAAVPTARSAMVASSVSPER